MCLNIVQIKVAEADKMLNCSKLLDHQSGIRPGVLQNSNLPEEEDKALVAAREIIRADLRRDLPRLLNLPEDCPKPKFIMQGSKRYKTLNKPYYPPGQQADLDDGVYVPVDILQDQSPSIASKGYIETVDAILARTAENKNWRLETSNPCCSRLVISDTAHIDIPKYCMPVAEYLRIVEARKIEAAKSLAANAGDASGAGSYFREDDEWDLIDYDKVRLAHREEGWINSDPRKVNDWVDDQAAQQPLYRKIVRLLKVWRDHQDWENDDPKSILLMAAAAEADWPQDQARIDEVLLHIVDQMARILSGPVANPGDCGGKDDLTQILDRTGSRQDVIQKFQSLARALRFAIEETDDPAAAIQRLREQFGPRLPDDADLLATDTANSDTGLLAAAAPVIRLNRSG